MKIVILADQLKGGGGAGVVAWNHAAALSSRGNEVTVITTSTYPDEVGVRTEDGIVIHTLLSRYRLLWRAYTSLNNKKVVKKVGEILATVKPDIVHAHNLHLHLSYAALLEAKKYAKGVFLTVHDAMPFHYSKLFPETVGATDGNVKSYKVSGWTQFRLFTFAYNPFRNKIIKKYLQIPTKIFAVSAALAQALDDNGIGNVEVLHNGIDVKEWETPRATSPDGRNFIFFGGRLSAVKGGGVLLAALRDVLLERSNTRLLIVGEENDFARRMKAEATSLGIEELILFTGERQHSEMKHMYPLATLVAVPSLCFDWFPTIVLEAMASRKPVIATCFGGSKEMVVEGTTGFIVNPLSVKEVTEKILLLLNNPHLVEEMGNAGYERVKNEFSMEKHVAQLLAWYDRSLHSK